MSINIINTNSGQDFSSCIPAILINKDGDYVAISGVSGGTGDVIGPVGATANALALFNGGTGKIIKNSSILVAGDDATFLGDLKVADGKGLVSTALGQTINISSSSGVSIGGNNGNVIMGTSYPGYAQVIGGGNASLVSTEADAEVIASAGQVHIVSSGQSTINSTAANVSLLAKTNVVLAAGYVSGPGNISLSAPSGKVILSTPSVSGTMGNNTLLIDNTNGFKHTWDNGGGVTSSIKNDGYAGMSYDGLGGSGTYVFCYPTQILTKGDFLPVGTSGTALIGSAAHPYGAVHSDALIVVSPNGSQWKLTVDNAGVVSGVSYP